MGYVLTDPGRILRFLTPVYPVKRRKQSCNRALTARTEVSIISKKYKKKGGALARTRFQNSVWPPVLLGLLFFIILSLGATDVIKTTVMLIAAASLLVLAVRFKTLRERISLPLIALTLCVLMDGISTFYAVSGKFALREFLKVFLAFLLAVILLASSPKREELKGRRIAVILAVCAAFGSLVSIDLISTRWISGAVLGILGLFTDAYKSLVGVETGIRMISMFTNPNTYAGFAGIGVLLSLGLVCHCEEGRKRIGCLVLLYVNALGFLLAFSMGASAFIALAFLVLLALETREKRAGLLLLMIETLILVVISAALISATSFSQWDGARPVPLLCTILGAAALCLADRFPGRRLAEKLGKHGKLVVILIAAVLVLAALFAAAAWNLTGEITLAPGESLRRAAYPEPGDYTLSLQAEGALNVRIVSQNRQETMMHTETTLYSGAASEAAFTVPEDSQVVYFTFTAPQGAHIASASSGGETIPLRYLLLPEFISNRLQGIFANENAIQRLVFFEDGIKLFHRRPLIGLGMGAFENAIMSVQSFFYETKYAHNHYIQSLLETGVIGLVLFVTLLVVSAIAVWKARREHPYAPMLGAALVFMAGHASTEVVFSAYAYLPMAYGVFALINLCCGKSLKWPKLSAVVRSVGMAVAAIAVVIYCCFLWANIAAQRIVSENPSFDTLEQGMRLDKFEWADYALPYVLSAKEENTNVYIRQRADVYAERLSTVSSNSIPIYLADYYFSTERTEQAIAMLEKYVDYVASDPTAWQETFAMLRANEEDSEVFRSGVVRLAQKLEQWNAENMGDIQLNEESREFLAKYL